MQVLVSFIISLLKGSIFPWFLLRTRTKLLIWEAVGKRWWLRRKIRSKFSKTSYPLASSMHACSSELALTCSKTSSMDIDLKDEKHQEDYLKSYAPTLYVLVYERWEVLQGILGYTFTISFDINHCCIVDYRNSTYVSNIITKSIS